MITPINVNSSLRIAMTAAILLVFEGPVAANTTEHTHTFARDDAARSVCTTCNHGFFRYMATSNALITPKSSSLKDADGNILNIISNQYIDGEGVMEFDAPLVIIDTKSFYGKYALTGDLILPNTVKKIGDQAFYNCYSLNGRLHLPAALTTLGVSVFEGCTALKGSIVIPSHVTSIGAKAFRDCWQFDGTITFPPTLTTISDNAFEGCSSLTGFHDTTGDGIEESRGVAGGIEVVGGIETLVFRFLLMELCRGREPGEEQFRQKERGSFVHKTG